MTSSRGILFIINMADQLREEFSDADLLCSSSSFEESSGMSDVEDETSDVLFHPMNSGVQPYQFEPERLDESTSTNSESDGEEFVNDDWCRCNNCQQMATAAECRCCTTTRCLSAKMEEYKEETGHILSCIVDHPGFSTVCLDRYVLDTAYLQYRQQYGEMNIEDDNK